MRLADRTSRISSSPTMDITATVDRLRREGIEIIDLGAGEPDFPTPAQIVLAGHAAIDAGFTRYTPVRGIADLQRAVCERYRVDYGVHYAESQVIITAGGKQALFNTALAVFNPGDEVITHTPHWPTLSEQIKLADATPILVSTHAEEGFAIRAKGLLDAVTPRTRGIVINSPCNPTGALISETELETVAREAAKRDIWVIVDLCYERLIYEPGTHNLPAVLARHCPEQGVLCGSVSKTYAMSGWRCGWTIAPAAVVAAEGAIQSHATSNVSSITQKAAVAALAGSQEPVAHMLNEYRKRRDSLHQWLNTNPRVRCGIPAGAFYMFVDISDALSLDGFRTSAEFARALLDEMRVAVTPGEAFDAPGFIRLSYATSMDNLREGSRRLLEFIGPHVPTPQPVG